MRLEKVRLMTSREMCLRGKNVCCPGESDVAGRAASGLIVDDLVAVRDDAGVLQFAQHYGFLEGYDELHERAGWLFEPIADWITLAGQVRAIRELAAAFHAGGPLDVQAFESLQLPKEHPRGRLRFKPTRANVPLLLSSEVSGLLYRANVRPVLLWDREQQSFRVTVKTGLSAFLPNVDMPPSSLGLIAHVLLYEVMNIETPVACSICGEEYQPERTASASRKHYCPTCRGGPEMWRRLKATQRAKAVSDKKL